MNGGSEDAGQETTRGYRGSYARLQRAGLRFQTGRHGNRNRVERVFRGVKCRATIL